METLIISYTFNTTREELFSAWTNPQIIEKWYGPVGMTSRVHELEIGPGGRYRISMTSEKRDTYIVSGEFTEVIPPEKLVFTWKWEENNNPESTVTIELKEMGGKTEMILTHAGLVDEKDKESHNTGWTSSFEKLEKMF